MKNFFQQKPVELKPKELVPDGTDLNSLSDSIIASKAKIEAENKKNLDKFLADEREIIARQVRAEMADDAKRQEKEKAEADKREWHARNARATAEKEARKKAARQIELKSKLSALAAAIADAALIVEEIEDKSCLQIKLLHEAASQLCHSLKLNNESQS